MKQVWLGLICVFGIASCWDGATTVTGTYEILGPGGAQVVMALVFALVIAAFLLCTSQIFEQGDDFLGTLLKAFWFIALVFDLYTSYLGNKAYLAPGALEPQQFILLLGMTVLVSGAPIFVSLIWHKRLRGFT